MKSESTQRNIGSTSISAYIESLVNRFFKILPMRENGEATLDVYMRGLQCELLGCQNLMPMFSENDAYISLLSILQFLIDNPECPVAEVKREVFAAISICKKMTQLLNPEGAESK